MPTRLKLAYEIELLSPPLSTPTEAVVFLRSIWDNSIMNIQEQFYILFLNANNEVITWTMLNSGADKECPVFVKLAVAESLICLASKVIVAHNHPSGELTPSRADIRCTNKLYRALQLIDITLVDHVILSDKSHFSFLDNDIEIE